MNLRVLMLFASVFVVSQAHAGFTSQAGHAVAGFATSKSMGLVVDYSVGSGGLGAVVSETGSELVNDLLWKPIFAGEKAEIKPVSLATTATKTAAIHYSAPAVAQGAMYALGLSAMSNPISAFLIGIVSQLAVSQVVHVVMKGVA